ncbi:MAG: SRPBCC domain-containing protein [Cyanobacteria bacterium P01_D01_bin.73]
MPQDCQANTVKTAFSRSTSVSILISAVPKTVWGLLTTAADYPQWNSTVISVEGDIQPGGTLVLISTLDPSRKFKLNVKEFEPETRLVWGDRQGNRVYTLEKRDDKTVLFSMTEKIGGILFPLYGRYIPPFDKAFEQFAMDLKQAAETREAYDYET